MATLGELVAADTYRACGKVGWRETLRLFRLRKTFRPVLTMRLCQHAAKKARWALPILRRLHARCEAALGAEIPWTAEYGPGLLVLHGWGVVINQSARLGANVTLMHGVTIGQADRIDRMGGRVTVHCVIGDDVWVGPGAIVVGCSVGDGARILGNAFVTRDVPAKAMVGGNPATIMKADAVPDVPNRTPLALAG